MTVFHDDLQCHVLWLSYDFAEQRLNLFLPRNNCTDMSGSIRLAKRISTSVKRIVVVVNDKNTGGYHLTTDGWRSSFA